MNLPFADWKKKRQGAGTVTDEDIIEHLLELVHKEENTYNWYKLLLSKWLTDKLPVIPDDEEELKGED